MSGAGDATDDEPSETLLESLLSTLDAEESQEPWDSHVERPEPAPDETRSATAVRALRALADAKRRERASTEPAQSVEAGHDGETESEQAPRDETSDACPVLSVIERAQPFDGLVHIGPALDRRLGTTRRVRAVVDGDTRRVDVRTHTQPTDGEGDFEASLTTQVERWESVGDVEGVVPVVAAGTADRPWVATASVGSTVRGRGDSLGLSLFHACRLTGALAQLHDRGIVHAGIDPRNVVYPISEAGDRPAPAFSNVGLADVYRRHTDPARVLDPRYAAPEYFDDAVGIVDRTTDIYQLGTLLVTLLTGEPPVEGSPETVRASVLDGDLPNVAAHDPRLPPEVDEILARATARDPFDRYDTAHAFHRDLTALCERLLE